MLFFKYIAAIIQPRWLIDEKAINLRKDVMFNPPRAPVILVMIIIIIINLFIEI